MKTEKLFQINPTTKNSKIKIPAHIWASVIFVGNLSKGGSSAGHNKADLLIDKLPSIELSLEGWYRYQSYQGFHFLEFG